METIQQPTIIVIFGITGDLASRSLLPALAAIADAGAFAPHTKIIGITRREISKDDLLASLPGSDWLRNNLELLQLNPAVHAEYEQLKQRLTAIDAEFGAPSQRLLYLSLPPQVSGPIISCLGESGIAEQPDTKLLLEKPFGTDLESAKELVTHVLQYFTEDQIYRIDHFLAKEMAQNLIVFRESNALFHDTWNSNFIESISVLLSETIDIEGRANFYEQTGAVRDVIQSHVLQLLALVLMEVPAGENTEQNIPAARLAALQKLSLPHLENLGALRGQYDGYTDEVAQPHSSVETFAQLSLLSSDPNWDAVPLTITAGKALAETTTEIHLRYRRIHEHEANELVLRVQPNEGISIDLWVKKPGYDHSLEKQSLSFAYNMHYEGLPKAYERVFIDAMRGDHRLFATSDEVIESWRIIDPILKHWQFLGQTGLIRYPKGQAAAEVAAQASQL